METYLIDSNAPRRGAIVVTVTDSHGIHAAATNAKVYLYTVRNLQDTTFFNAASWKPRSENLVNTKRTNREGRVTFDGLEEGCYVVAYGHYPITPPQCIDVRAGCIENVCFELDLHLQAISTFLDRDCKPIPCTRPRMGDKIEIEITGNINNLQNAVITPPQGFKRDPENTRTFSGSVLKTGRQRYLSTVAFPEIDAPAGAGGGAIFQIPLETDADEASIMQIGGNVGASLTRTETSFTEDMAFWTAIRNSTETLSFNNYLNFMDWIFCGGNSPVQGFEANRFSAKNQEYQNLINNKRFLPFTDSDAYRVVKAATEAFVMVNCGVLQGDLQPFDADSDNAYLDRRDLPIPQNGLDDVFNEDYLVSITGNGKVLPYLAVIRRKLPDIPIKSGAFGVAVADGELDNCFGLLQEKLVNPCLLELIWSYWHEEGMLVQTMNALSRRFQNVRSSAQDPLANLEMNPLRPLNNLLWGYIQDEQHRLTINRRNYEYDHHYGLHLEGKAVQNFRPVDTRSKFLEAFHHLLRLCTVFYKQDDDTTVKADAFPVLNALKEVHLILSQGAHNQFGDLPSTARIEMLMQQWLLARPEFKEFLPGRIMVAYPEPWMDRVDGMKKLQGWTDTSVLHFRNLAMFGEQLLLSIRWGHWSDEFEPVKALNWARFFRPQAQGYIHAYRAATGVDLSADPTVSARVDSTLPSVLLQKRLASQQRTI